MRRLSFALPLLVAALVAACGNYGFNMEQNMKDAGYTQAAGPATTLTAPPTIDVNTVQATVQAIITDKSLLSMATKQAAPKVKQNDQTKQYKSNSTFGAASSLNLVGASSTVDLTITSPASIPYTADNRMGMPELGNTNAGTSKKPNRGFWWSVTIKNTTTSVIEVNSVKYFATAGSAACKDMTGQDTAGHNFFGPLDYEKIFTDPSNASKVQPGESISFDFATACQADKGVPLTLRVFSGDKDEKARIYNSKLP